MLKRTCSKKKTANFLLRGVGTKPALEGQTVPALAYMIFQAMFAALTPGNTRDKMILINSPIFFLALAFGSAAERMSVSFFFKYIKKKKIGYSNRVD